MDSEASRAVFAQQQSRARPQPWAFRPLLAGGCEIHLQDISSVSTVFQSPVEFGKAEQAQPKIMTFKRRKGFDVLMRFSKVDYRENNVL